MNSDMKMTPRYQINVIHKDSVSEFFGVSRWILKERPEALILNMEDGDVVAIPLHNVQMIEIRHEETSE